MSDPVLGAASAAALPLRHDDPVTMAVVMKITLLLLLLLALAYVVLRWYAGKKGLAGMHKDAELPLSCVASCRLSAKTRVYMLKADGHSVLVAESASGQLTVTALPVVPAKNMPESSSADENS